MIVPVFNTPFGLIYASEVPPLEHFVEVEIKYTNALPWWRRWLRKRKPLAYRLEDRAIKWACDLAEERWLRGEI